MTKQITLVDLYNPNKDKKIVTIKDRLPVKGEALTIDGITYKIINYNTVIDTEQDTQDLVALVEIIK